MSAAVLDLDSFRKKKDPFHVFIGDIIEWVDYDGRKVVSKVLDIETIDVEHAANLGTTVWENANMADLKYKSLYSFKLADGLTLLGEAVTRKIV